MPIGAAPTAPIATLGDVADLVAVLVWPVAILATVYILRDPLRLVVRRIGTSASSVSIGPGGVTVDFGSAVTEVAPEGATPLADLRSPALAIGGDAAQTLFAQLESEEPAPHLLVDLGEGHEWLSSRLYLFAVMLATMRRTRTLIFVETLNGVRGRFVGLAAPLRVRYGLAHEYPWLEADYAAAYAEATKGWADPPAMVNRLVLDDHGRLAPLVVPNLVNEFIKKVQNAPSPERATPVTAQWVDLTVNGPDRKEEHAQWLRGGDVERVLEPGLERWAYLTETVPRSPSEIAAAALQMSGYDSVAVVDDQHRFKGAVVDRRKALEAFADQAGRTESDAKE